MSPSPVEMNVQKGTKQVTPNEKSFDDEMYRVPETINFPDEEEKTLQFWSENKIFEKCLQQSKGKPKYDNMNSIDTLRIILIRMILNNTSPFCFLTATPFMMGHRLLQVCRIMVTFWLVQ